jgi:hypothetical protein
LTKHYCHLAINEKIPIKREEPVSFKPTGDYEKILSNCSWQLHLMMLVYRENMKEVFPGYGMFVTIL